MQSFIVIMLLVAFGIVCFGLNKSEQRVPSALALVSALLGLGLGVKLCLDLNAGVADTLDFIWLPDIGAHFALMASTTGALMVLLTGICFAAIFMATWGKNISRSGSFYGLMLLSMAGLIGVFTANDGFTFYLFWELALIPVYFLANMYGGERRQAVSFKFFIYTFVGSLIMLLALIMLYNSGDVHSFAWQDLVAKGASLDAGTQNIIFWMMFVAFAIKMPIFPLHTWQPDAYEQTFTPVTIVLSAVMVKMGLWAVLHWLQPIVPAAFNANKEVVIILSIIGIVYASLLAMVQQDMKRVVAYSSIAHIGLMCAAIFAGHADGSTGAVLQMFNHGVNILGMWLLLYFVEDRVGERNLSKLGGFANSNSTFAILMVLITLANVALPLTNGFAGEFLMFRGLFASNTAHPILYTSLAGLGIILGAVYSLNLVQKITFGESKFSVPLKFSNGELAALLMVASLILAFGFYPQAILNFIK
jgi:NADH-quinone oxidoreductase subunit M